MRARITKVNAEKRLVTVVVTRCADQNGNPYVDHDGDVIDVSNLEDIFIKSFFDDSASRGGGGEMHETHGGADVVMWFTVDKRERDVLGFGPGDEMGIAKIRVNDDDLWEKVKSGEYPEVSIEGFGERTPMEVDE